MREPETNANPVLKINISFSDEMVINPSLEVLCFRCVWNDSFCVRYNKYTKRKQVRDQTSTFCIRKRMKRKRNAKKYNKINNRVKVATIKWRITQRINWVWKSRLWIGKRKVLRTLNRLSGLQFQIDLFTEENCT